jgi:hypothetical protein
MKEGGIWRVRGYLARKFVTKTKSCAFVTMEYSDRGRKAVQEAVAFDAALIDQVDRLGDGECIDARGELMREALKDKGKRDVEVDGRKVWITKLRLLGIEVVQRPESPPLDDPQDDGASDHGATSDDGGW